MFWFLYFWEMGVAPLTDLKHLIACVYAFTCTYVDVESEVCVKPWSYEGLCTF